MKYFFLLIILVNSLLTISKEVNQLVIPAETVYVQHAIEVKNYIIKEYSAFLQENISLELSFEKTTKYSHHYSFIILYKNIPIVNSMIKVNTNTIGKIMSLKIEHGDLQSLSNLDIENSIKVWAAKDIDYMLTQSLNYVSDIKESNYKIVIENEKASLVLEVKSWNKNLDRSDYFSSNGKLILSYDHQRNLIKDSIIKVAVFNPDPLTVSGVVYGGIFKDNGDTHQPWMLPTYDTMNILATYDTGNSTFYLENQWAIFDDFELPNYPPTISLVPSFYFHRNEIGFEDCNAFYHITHFHDYFFSLGYDSLMDLQLKIDAHGQNGQDNSAFFRNGGNPTISFGTGGVDDAEDADVIIHEYSHGISWSANNNANFTQERSGLDEGLADYFATSYSRTLNIFSWQNVFTWDGHNEFWTGRIANNTSLYPIAGNIYNIGEVWNAVMSEIWADLGAVITDKLMLESLHFYTDQTTLPEAAKYLIQSDSILFNGIHVPILCTRFKNRNILDGNCQIVSVKDIHKLEQITIRNLLGFANNEGALILDFQLPFSGHISIYNLSGQVLLNEYVKDFNSYAISPTQFKTGIYVLKLQSNHGNKTIKLIKH